MCQNYDRRKRLGDDCMIAYAAGDPVDGYQSIRIGNAADRYLHALGTRLFDKHGLYSAWATKNFIERAEAWKPDIIHLHNIHDYYLNYELLFAWIKAHPEREIIWTLHDCWAFTGHCSHFTIVKCEQWKTHCSTCCQLHQYPKCIGRGNVGNNFERKKAAFCNAKNLTITVPSRWLADLVKQSFLRDYPVRVIPNPLNTEVFKPTPGDFRERYGLADYRIVLGVALQWSDRKGLDDFVRLYTLLPEERYRIVLVGVTREQQKKLPRGILCIGRTNSQTELAQIYSAADYFVNPSREETYGMTTAEAAACGAKTIVYQETACEEVALAHGGIAVAPSAETIADVILRAG